jgi:hypothetical protein
VVDRADRFDPPQWRSIALRLGCGLKSTGPAFGFQVLGGNGPKKAFQVFTQPTSQRRKHYGVV